MSKIFIDEKTDNYDRYIFNSYLVSPISGISHLGVFTIQERGNEYVAEDYHGNEFVVHHGEVIVFDIDKSQIVRVE